MTAKEKSKELQRKFYKHVIGFDEDKFTRAKQCALISVDEIIEVTTNEFVVLNGLTLINYWEEVKKEIEKL